MQKELIAFLLESELKLKPDTRTWLWTENLKSAFGAFKQLEGKQSKGGFTSLVAARPIVLASWTPQRVCECFTAVSIKQTREWINKNLGQTLTSKRREAFRECRKHRLA